MKSRFDIGDKISYYAKDINVRSEMVIDKIIICGNNPCDIWYFSKYDEESCSEDEVFSCIKVNGTYEEIRKEE